MGTGAVTDIFRDAVGVAIRLGGPILVLTMAIGVVTAIFQAVTQIHEQTIAFLLKVVVVVLYLAIGGGWMLQTLQSFARQIFLLM